MNSGQDFAYDRGIAPMMWVLFALSLIELLAVHFFVALKWPWIGWPLSILSALGALWILVWIRSLKSLPHNLSGDLLTLRLGNLNRVEVDLSNVERVTGGWEQGATNSKGIINLAGIAYPNRCVELKEPVRGNKRRVFIKLDEPEGFDSALSARGIAIS